jgi:peptide/nickel transport system substrate-binding protein
MYIGRDLNNSGRLFYRSLVALPASNDPVEGITPVPDLATDTGKTTDGGKTWSFTVRDDVKWEDGKPITCEDFKYGASRNFATDVIIGGPANYLFTYLDIPTGDDGLPEYKGPYKADKAQQEMWDKAVSCDGQTITYHMKKPWPDFPSSIAQLRYLDPYRADQDKGDASNFEIFSNGPYKLQGKWTEGTGGTFVRNENWDPATDTIRKALPDQWDFREGDEDEAIYEQLFADSGDAQYGVTERRIPPTFYGRIPEAEDRYTHVESPYVDYVLPNFNSPVFKNPACREALALATNKEAWIKAGGGEKAFTPAYSVVNPSVPGYKENPAFADIPDAGDVDAAKAKLADCPGSHKIKFTYSGGTPTSDKQASALKESWDAAGFETELDPLTDTYYAVIQKPDADFDVTWGGWGADWASIGTVIPPLFDSRINLTGDSNGNDYGNYKGGPEVDKLIDEAYAETDLDAAADKWAEVDAKLGEDVAYIPLEITLFNFLHGSKITGYENTVAVNGYADLALIGVSS